MKSINSSVLPNGLDSQNLQSRRAYPTLDTAAIKRHSHRVERRLFAEDLRKHLQSYVAEGREAARQKRIRAKAKDKVVFLNAGNGDVPATNGMQRIMRWPKANVLPFGQREIKVIRKRAFHRAVVETLLLAA